MKFNPGLPAEFLRRMEALLGQEYPEFIASYEQERYYGLRVNTLKVSVPQFQKLAPFRLESVPWAPEGFYFRPEDEPGKHPYHAAGLYYIQEPSAMVAGSILDPQPGECILDLAAAPGGKTTHLATKMQGTGLLVANEINRTRAKVLSQNVERLGLRNCLVLNETPERLAQRFPEYFQRVLVDAPCSGEGMFRKDPAACAEWSQEHVLGCATRQTNILESAAYLVAPGGLLLYSTCTFAPQENEEVVARFLATHKNFQLEKIPYSPGFVPGRLPQTVRLWPHRIKGEGHFIALFRKAAQPSNGQMRPIQQRIDQREIQPYLDFVSSYLTRPLCGEYAFFGPNLYLLPPECPDLAGLQVLRPGLQLGSIRKGHFVPAHALALTLTPDIVHNTVNYEAESTEVLTYLRGETLSVQGKPGWYLVTVDGLSLGWGKLTGTTLKNHYPKGLRRIS